MPSSTLVPFQLVKEEQYVVVRILVETSSHVMQALPSETPSRQLVLKECQ